MQKIQSLSRTPPCYKYSRPHGKMMIVGYRLKDHFHQCELDLMLSWLLDLQLIFERHSFACTTKRNFKCRSREKRRANNIIQLGIGATITRTYCKQKSIVGSVSVCTYTPNYHPTPKLTSQQQPPYTSKLPTRWASNKCRNKLQKTCIVTHMNTEQTRKLENKLSKRVLFATPAEYVDVLHCINKWTL